MHELQKLIQQARKTKRWTRSRLAEEASKVASVDVSLEWIEFVETAIQRVPEPRLMKPVALVLGIPWSAILNATGQGDGGI